MATPRFQLCVNGTHVAARCLNPETLKDYEPCNFGDDDVYDYHNYGYSFLIDYTPHKVLIILLRDNKPTTTIGYIEKIIRSNFPEAQIQLPSGSTQTTKLKDCVQVPVKLSDQVEDYRDDD